MRVVFLTLLLIFTVLMSFIRAGHYFNSLNRVTGAAAGTYPMIQAAPELFVNRTFKAPLTIVSMLYDINRNGRPVDYYYELIGLSLKVNAPWVIFTTRTLYEQIKGALANRANVMVLEVDLEQLPFARDLGLIEQIISKNEYRERMQNSGRIECTNPYYSLIQFSKIHFLEKTADLNPFSSSKFMWMDGGISRFYGQFDLKQQITGSQLTEDMFFISMHRETFRSTAFRNRDPIELIWKESNFFIGGIFGGTQAAILKMKSLLEQSWSYMLNHKCVNNEQVGFMLAYFNNPEPFDIFVRRDPWNWNLQELFDFLV